MSSGPRLPDFLVIGAMKAGTTTLYHLLAGHPDVYMSPVKEPNYFSDPAVHARGLPYYTKLFAGAEAGQRCGEASTSYSRALEYPGVPERIMAAALPDIKFVYLLRDPLVRMRSMHRHEVLAGREQRGLEEALLGDPRYLDASCYGRQLRVYLQHFAREQMAVLTLEELAADQQAVMDRLFRFLELPPLDLQGGPVFARYRSEDRRQETALSRRIRRSGLTGWARMHLPEGVRGGALRVLTRRATDTTGAPELSEGALEQLRDSLRPDLAELAEFLGPQFDCWGLRSPAS